MKLVTTMGIELTYMPLIWDWMFEQYGKAYAKKNGHKPTDDAKIETVVQGRGNDVNGAAYKMRTVFDLRNIQMNNVGIDPDCVEISTKPYSELDSLMRRARVVQEYAADFDLVPELERFNGGGAHIHTGTEFIKSEHQRERYIKRMMVFVAQNPWITWAFVGLADNTNAEPLTQDVLKMRNIPQSLKGLKFQLELEMNNLIENTNRLHLASEWKNHWRRTYWSNYISINVAQIQSLKKSIAFHDHGIPCTKFSLLGVVPNTSKDYALRYAADIGTVEFRVFEMPGDVEDLSRYIRFCDAVCRHVAAQNYASFDASLIPENASAARLIPLEARLEGFRNMLLTLGLDPSEFEQESAQIEGRFKYYKDKAYQSAHKRKMAKKAALKKATSEDSCETVAQTNLECELTANPQTIIRTGDLVHNSSPCQTYELAA